MPVSPPRPKGPPLNALRAFEAAARLGGFALAADELCVTSGAIAQHIKAVEAWAGGRLFERRSHGVELTDVGASILPAFSAAFDQLGVAVQALRSRTAPNHIRIAALPSIAQLWLSPQLPALRDAAPDITLSVTALETPPNLTREPYDLCVFFESDPIGAGSISLGQDTIFPVCAPAVAATLHDTRDLAQIHCLHDSTWSDDWALWVGQARPEAAAPTHGPTFSLYSLAIQEAINGAGLLIGHEPLVREYLKTGTLVAPFETRVSLDRHLVITLASPATPNPAVRGILDRLLENARDLPASISGS